VRLLTVGSIAFDTIETPRATRERIIGGSANFASAAAVHFVAPAMVGVVGDDYPEEWLAALRARGVDTSGVRREPGESFFWHARYHDNFADRTTVTTRLGIFERFDPRVPEALRDAELVFLANITPDLQARVLGQLARPAFTAMDTMNLWIRTAREKVLALVPAVDCVLVNDEELAGLTGAASPFEGLRELARMGARVVVVKMGPRGSVLFAGGSFFWAPAFPVADVVDPTGAGDSFAGAFLGCIGAMGGAGPRDLKRALLYASAVASFAVEAFEPRALLGLTRDRIQERYMFLRHLINY